MARWNSKRSISPDEHIAPKARLKQRLGWPLLLALGVGGVVTGGITLRIAERAETIGPAVVLAIVIAGLVCACVALAYAEMATKIPDAGGAYSYSYAVLGELPAWLIGWSLVLAYLTAAAFVALVSSNLSISYLRSLGIELPAMQAAPGIEEGAGSLIDLPPILLVALLGGLLAARTRIFLGLNGLLVAAKLVALLFLAALLLPRFTPDNFGPFIPFGFDGSLAWDGKDRSVIAVGAAFLSTFLGFETVANASEEVRDPQRNIPIGILGSAMFGLTVYLLIAGTAVGAIAQYDFRQDGNAIIVAASRLGGYWPARLIEASATIASLTLLAALLFALSRLLFAMARDGLLPSWIARVSGSGTPVLATIFTAVLVAALAGFAGPEKLLELAGVGAPGMLVASIAVAACMLVARKRTSDAPGSFRTPLAWPIAMIAIAGCAYLLATISTGPVTDPEGESSWSFQLQLLGWYGAGLAGYFVYGRKRSILTLPEEIATDVAIGRILDGP